MHTKIGHAKEEDKKEKVYSNAQLIDRSIEVDCKCIYIYIS